MKIILSLLVLITAVAYAADAPTPNTATKDAPFVNSLGMKFVPVEITGGPTNGKRVLFSIWDTRVQDYAMYAKDKGIVPVKPEFEQGPTHPVVDVSWFDAKAFCDWLTITERASKTIGYKDKYRLPSDHEWTCAIGIGKLENPYADPGEKDGKIEKVYPWGADAPPPKLSGNYASLLKSDPFDNTSPVGSFVSNPYGLYDMGGNVWQWCQDQYRGKGSNFVCRGASFNMWDERFMRSSARAVYEAIHGNEDIGFRCVLEVFDSDETN